MIHSVAGDLAGGQLTDRRPFRAPHHSASMAALVGGGSHAKPGEASLAHNGVLFLDELPEFQSQAIDALRQPLESGEVAISRANRRCVYPARFQLIAAMNPCRCGLANEPGHRCQKGSPERCSQMYQNRLSGPFLDRIDLHLEVPAVRASDLILPAPNEGSAQVGARVAQAREIQRARYKRMGHDYVACNAMATSAVIEQTIKLDDAGGQLIRDASERLRLSARGFHRVLKLARTIADLEGSPEVLRSHLGEALSYRLLTNRLPAAAQ
jgi:magnesium chelatase family protein